VLLLVDAAAAAAAAVLLAAADLAIDRYYDYRWFSVTRQHAPW
jgi:hypothetical protein